MKTMLLIMCVFGSVCLKAQTPGSGNILYVKKGSNGNGTSWSDALGELSEALSWASGWDPANEGMLRIWVAQGQYMPTPDSNDRQATFQLVNGVWIFGGFSGEAGTEGDMSGQDGKKYVTILSGDIDNNDKEKVVSDPIKQIVGKNSYAVVNGSHTDNRAVINGFTITAGTAEERTGDGNSIIRCGGGIYIFNGRPTLENLIITGNMSLQGNGICNIEGSNLKLVNVELINNR